MNIRKILEEKIPNIRADWETVIKRKRDYITVKSCSTWDKGIYYDLTFRDYGNSANITLRNNDKIFNVKIAYKYHTNGAWAGFKSGYNVLSVFGDETIIDKTLDALSAKKRKSTLKNNLHAYWTTYATAASNEYRCSNCGTLHIGEAKNCPDCKAIMVAKNDCDFGEGFIRISRTWM